MMSRKERFMTAVKLVGVPDRVPMFDFLFQQPMYQALIGHKPGVYNARDAMELVLKLDHDGLWLPVGGYNGFQPQYLDADTYIDEWGTTYRTSEYAWPIDAPIDYPIKSRDDWKHYKRPDPTLPGRVDEVNIAIRMKEDIAIAPGVTGPFTTCWLLMGYERICFALYDDPEILTEIFQMSNDFNKEAARRAVEAGGEAIWLGDDLGDSARGFMKLSHFRKYYLPYLVDLTDYITGLGVPVLLHCCGRFIDYLPDLAANTKIAAIHPLQRTAGMDLRDVKERFGKRFCIIGNIDSSRTLPYGTPEEVAAEVREAIDIAAPGGGYVLASDHSLHDGISVENILTLFRVGKEYGSLAYQTLANQGVAA
jgi:uroporphyrinogen decarboxylase